MRCRGWRELGSLDIWERAALAVTEALVVLDDIAAREEALHHGLDVLGERGLAQVVAAVATISAWNRLMVASGTQPDPGQA